MTVRVSPILSGQFAGVVYDATTRAVLAMTLPTTDRNKAAREGLRVRSLVRG